MFGHLRHEVIWDFAGAEVAQHVEEVAHDELNHGQSDARPDSGEYANTFEDIVRGAAIREDSLCFARVRIAL